MRILYLSPWFPYPLDTGSRIRVYHQLQALARRHKVTLLTLDPQGWAPAQVEPVEPLCQQLALIPRDPFHRGRLRTATRFFFLRPIVNIPFAEMTRLVCRLHTEQPFDVVIASSTVMARYALALSSIPHILEEHNSHTRWMHERYSAQASPLQRLRCWVSWRKSTLYESRLFPRFDLVTMTSEQDVAASRSLLRSQRPPVALVPNGVDCAEFRPGLATPQPDTLVFSGSLAYDANYEAVRFFLRQVYPEIQRQRPDAKLLITGSTKGVDLSDLAVHESMTLTGFVEDIRPLIAGSCASIVPIL